MREERNRVFVVAVEPGVVVNCALRDDGGGEKREEERGIYWDHLERTMSVCEAFRCGGEVCPWRDSKVMMMIIVALGFT